MGTGDGDYDLIIQGANDDQSRDKFDPDWNMDSMLDGDERYLKKIGAWFDVDRDATTPAGSFNDEGKIVIDNTAPTIDPASFKPR